MESLLLVVFEVFDERDSFSSPATTVLVQPCYHCVNKSRIQEVPTQEENRMQQTNEHYGRDDCHNERIERFARTHRYWIAI